VPTKKRGYHHGNLRQALVEAADLTARARALTTLLSINAAESGDEDTPPSLQ